MSLSQSKIQNGILISRFVYYGIHFSSFRSLRLVVKTFCDRLRLACLRLLELRIANYEL
ncbi:MAG: hypothetical protein IGR93_00600 [Hydrococcus sp. C42_A2020_068]|nr:hypothetical protein [Hydrococcus sp. C42_A2020_068]